MIDAILIGSPARPSLNFEGRSGSPRIRLRVIQEIDTMYDARIAAVDKDAIFIRAAEEPRLINERRQDTTNERHIELMGTSHVGGIYKGQNVKIKQVAIDTDIGKSLAKRYALIACKSEELPG